MNRTLGVITAAALAITAVPAWAQSTLKVRPFGDLTNGFATAGMFLCLAGLTFAVWARVSLGRSWGMPMAQHDNPELVTSGPYALVRHPIYTALAAMLIGTSLVFPVAVIPCAATIVYMVFAAHREELDMEQRFPGAYSEYTRRSKFIVPFLL